jgi:hypothetical protein
VIVLDENIVDGQRLLLEGWNVTARQVGLDVGRKGLKDEEIVVLLRRLRQPTFFTRDLGFYTPELSGCRGSVRASGICPPLHASP